MKEYKDAFIPDNVHYFLLGYLNETNFDPIYRRQLEKYDQTTGRPIFKSTWLTKNQVFEILQEAIEYYRNASEEINLENIDKYSN